MLFTSAQKATDNCPFGVGPRAAMVKGPCTPFLRMWASQGELLQSLQWRSTLVQHGVVATPQVHMAFGSAAWRCLAPRRCMQP